MDRDAARVDNTFDKITAELDRYSKIFRQGGGLEKAVDSIGGDIAWFNDIRSKLDDLIDTINDAHMYSMINHADTGMESVNEADGEGTYARVIYDYSENWGSIDIYKGHEKVDSWDDYFHSNETGNPLAAKFVEMAEANGLDPMSLQIVDENGDIGKFDGKTFKWGANEGRMSDQIIHDSETLSKEEFAKKHGKDVADEYYEELDYLKKLAGI